MLAGPGDHRAIAALFRLNVKDLHLWRVVSAYGPPNFNSPVKWGLSLTGSRRPCSSRSD
jgi:hypothetical protein